jgi:two-component system NarL family sensor kinase
MKLKLVLMSTALVLAALGTVAVMVRHQTLKLARQERQLVLSLYESSKEGELKHYVELARSAVLRLAQGMGDVASLQKEAMAVLSRMHFGKDGYFFVYDQHGNILLDPSQMGMQGIDFCDPNQPEGQMQANMLLTAARNGGGVVTYDWQKPSSQTYSRKMSYVVPVGPWNWVLGTGIYMDEVYETLDQIDQHAQKNIEDTLHSIFWIAGISIVLIGSAGLMVNLSHHRITSEKLRHLARRVVRSQEDERVRVARELHDGVVQVMVSSKYFLETAQIQQAQPGAGRARHTPQYLVEQGLLRLNDALSEIRRVSHGLRPALLDDLGLVPALRLLVEQLRAQSGLEVNLVECGTPFELPTSHGTALFRVVQEATNNIQAHAGASRVDITLAFGEGRVTLSIRDNGRGFDLKRVQTDSAGGIGLRNMRERIESLHGGFAMSSSASGTLIEAVLEIGPDGQDTLREET